MFRNLAKPSALGWAPRKRFSVTWPKFGRPGPDVVSVLADSAWAATKEMARKQGSKIRKLVLITFN